MEDLASFKDFHTVTGKGLAEADSYRAGMVPHLRFQLPMEITRMFTETPSSARLLAVLVVLQAGAVVFMPVEVVEEQF